jgi:Predicted RNA-binding protein homologous to eukaryotic snRNP
MPVNCNEIRLLVSELPLKESVIQAVTEHDFHSFTLSLFHKEEKAWFLYVEIGNPDCYICRTPAIVHPKAKKLQRFGQYFRANIIGSRITEVNLVEGERFFSLTLVHKEEVRHLAFRLYSGPGANVLVTDENYVITEAMMRRPRRGDSNGNILALPPAKPEAYEKFPVRPWEGDSFNSYIYTHYRTLERTEGREEKLEKLRQKENKAIEQLLITRRNIEKRIENTKGYDDLKETADILSAYAWKLKKGDRTATLEDFAGGTVTIVLDEKLSPSENVEQYYQKAQKNKKAYRLALEELEANKAEEKTTRDRFEAIFEMDDEIRQLKAAEALLKEEKESHVQTEAVLGLRVVSNGFDIIVGRNARENDQILRTLTRGSDIWMHTRDCPGGYVIIKSKKDKSVPLEVLLDAGNLAVHFSKAKDNGKADLYYTQCKYLRRAKDSKLGLVLPTQEKNLSITLDERRIQRLL